MPYQEDVGALTPAQEMRAFLSSLPATHPMRGVWTVPSTNPESYFSLGPYPGMGPLPWRDATLSCSRHPLGPMADYIMDMEELKLLQTIVREAPDSVEF